MIHDNRNTEPVQSNTSRGNSHDPLCDASGFGSPGECDVCDFIAKARADERAKRVSEDQWISAREAREREEDIRADERMRAWVRIIKLCSHTKYLGCPPCVHDQCGDAARNVSVNSEAQEERDLSPEAGGLHGEIPDTSESRSFFRQMFSAAREETCQNTGLDGSSARISHASDNFGARGEAVSANGDMAAMSANDDTHDLLCPFAEWPDEHCYQKDAGMSMCALIAKVRADEREKAAIDVAAIASWPDSMSTDEDDRICRHSGAISAARGET